MKRFNLLVLNYGRLNSFFDNFHRIQGFSKELDRITILSASPSKEESDAVNKFQQEKSYDINYLSRANYGMAEYARIEYFTGMHDSLEKICDYEYTFQFQEHYLDNTSTFSKWGKRYNYRVKGDVLPDGISIDLESLHETLVTNKVRCAFCDRVNPTWFSINQKKFIAPSGGNFVFKSSMLRTVQSEILALGRKCDNTYRWAVYAEYKWGEIFFKEIGRFYDMKRNIIFSEFPREEFYVDPKIEIPDKWFENKVFHLFYPLLRFGKKLKSSILRP